MEPIRTDAAKLAKFGKMISTAAAAIEALEVTESQVAFMRKTLADLTADKEKLAELNAQAQAQLEKTQAETKAASEAAKVNSEGVLVAAKTEADKLHAQAMEALDAAVKKAGTITGEAVLLRESAKSYAATKAKEAEALELKISKIKAAAKTFAEV
jgi:hypothetical protein